MTLGLGIVRLVLRVELVTRMMDSWGMRMAFLSKKFHTSLEVWNKYGTWKGAWMLVLPYLPHLPYLAPPTRIRGRARACVRARVYVLILSMEGMEGMEEAHG